MRNPLDVVFAGLYDAVMAGPEAAGLTRWRRELVGDLTGDVLEIGAGTGLNVPHYGPGARLTLLEPDPSMRARLAERAGDHTVVDGAAEALPFPDARFDAVVSGLVLCSVTDLGASLAEIRRVLRPGGRFVFIEHVVSDVGWVRAGQHLVEPLWKVAARGCHLTRDTGAALVQAGFEVDDVVRERLPNGGLPAIRGVARVADPGS
jgi:ubiquinone/menaquinone biosynthesis C-methylase UbiE